MHTVTLSFSDPGDARWFARMAADSIRISARLGPCSAGILQDSLACASKVEVELECTESVEHAHWETAGGTTAEENEARFS